MRWPRRKCSATVRPKKRPRPSGTWAIPSRARALGDVRARSSPSKRTRPAIGFTIPEIARSVVVLPAPFGPSSATTSPAATVTLEVPDHRRLVVAGGEPLEREDGQPCSASVSCDAALPRYAAMTRGVAADDVRRAARDDLAELEHDDLVADPEHEAHVVVDEQHRLAGVDEAPEPAAELLALVRVEPGRRLVEAHDARLRDERARDADELALALRERVRQLVRNRLEPEQLERGGDLALAAVGRRHRLADEPPDGRAVRGDEEVLAHGEVVEELDRLPRAREPELRAPVGRRGR